MNQLEELSTRLSRSNQWPPNQYGTNAQDQLNGFASTLNAIASDSNAQRDLGPQKMSYLRDAHPVATSISDSGGALRIDVSNGAFIAVPTNPQEVRVVP